MIFQHTWQKVLSGEKTQTRRRVKEGEGWACDYDDSDITTTVLRDTSFDRCIVAYRVGKDYAVQPGRSKPTINWQPPCRMDVIPLRVRVTSIRREDVRKISIADAHAEGFDGPGEFLKVWCDMHDKAAAWEFDPQQVDYWIGKGKLRELVSWERVMEMINARPRDRYNAWALTFEVVKDNQ